MKDNDLMPLNSLLCASDGLGKRRKENRMNRRFLAATTLIEVLVVIVIFAVGILAVIQVFPRGFQVLMQTRNRSVATNLGRAEIERVKSRPDQIPEQIVSRQHADGLIYLTGDRRPDELGPMGDAIARDGTLSFGSATVGNWQEHSGANNFRGIIGEGRRVPAPTWVSGLFGGLMVLQFSPVSVDQAELVYGSDLVRRTALTQEEERRQTNEYFVTDATTPAIALWLPSGPTDRRFRLAFTAFVPRTSGTGFWPRRVVATLPSGTATVPASSPDVYGNYPLYEVRLNTVVPNLYGAELDSIQVSRLFERIAPTTDFTDAYQYKVLNPSMGVLLFSPMASDERQPLTARVDYDVKDWRIIREEFRVADSANPQYRLALGNLKVGGQAGPDGQPNTAIFLERTDPGITQISDPKADHFILQDMVTGGLIAERAYSGGRQLVAVDKSLGLVTFFDANTSTPSIDAELLMPGATSTTYIPLANRPLRALYMANGEWSVQVLKAASTYHITFDVPGPGQYYVGGSNTAIGGLRGRIYFSPSETGRRVAFDELFVRDSSGVQRQLLGQDFQIAIRNPDPTGLPSIDVREVAGQNAVVSFVNGYPARGVKGASLAVRVLHNQATFSLTDDGATNIRRLEQWGRNWRRSTTETYIQRGDNIR
ncbi:MAG TPA: hypothetical protein VGE01_13460 [Fimbriimonas sp.]